MKVIISSKDPENIKPLLEKLCFEVVSENPDVVISYGGDGTLLSSERQFPSIPKIPIRDDSVARKCTDHQTENLLNKLKNNQLDLKQYSKLEAKINEKKLLALNDFVIRNKEPMHSIRFIVHPERAERVEGLLIGDGIVISTPFGSSGYFQSITRQEFKDGFGLAFNNTTEKMKPQFFKETDQIIFKLVRGQAALTSDNSPDIYMIPEGSEIIFKLSDQKAKIYELESLRCPNCIVTRG